MQVKVITLTVAPTKPNC